MLLLTLLLQITEATEYCIDGNAVERKRCLPAKIAELEKGKTAKPTVIEANKKERFIDYHPCSFRVSLPKSYIFEMEQDDNLDVCDATVTTANGLSILEVHSMINSRVETDDIQELYQRALANSSLEITHKSQKHNWFVISGYNSKGMIVYWKRISGDNFISDLYMEYPKSRSSEINPMIGRIADSFTSD